jgi:hypothetical protein
MAGINTLFQTTVQKNIEIEFLSRVNSIIGLVAAYLIPIGYALSGPAAAIVQARPTMPVGACLILLIFVGLLMVPEIRLFGRLSRNHRSSTAFRSGPG